MTQNNLKSSIEQALKDFNQASISDCIKHLFEILGYSTQREVLLDIQTPDEVVEVFGWENFREDKGLLKEWESVDCLFQVTEEDLTPPTPLIKGNLTPPTPLIKGGNLMDRGYLKSYIFLGLTLHKESYSRSQLASISREVNRQSDIPIMVLFRYGNRKVPFYKGDLGGSDYVTLSIINRRPNKLDRDKDVLEKITLIKDININSPHRAHIEILAKLSLFSLKDVQNFDELHTAWQKVLNTSELNKKFFQEVSNWYFWATQMVTFPDGGEQDNNIRNATSVIRLITRLIFVWFLKEKGLVTDALFDEDKLKVLLKSLASEESTYYKAILQNLFFATLNTEMNDPPQPPLRRGENIKEVPFTNKGTNRKFRGQNKQKGGRDQHYGVANVYRYQDYFTNSDDFLELCRDIPFLNGGLFESLDRDKDDDSQSSQQGKEKTIIRIDGFSDREDNPLSVPNILFFGEARKVDLNKAYGTSNKKYEVQGLINLFNRYKFTIDENTPIEEEIALDPELLGKVFENLLAEYNPETETTARKQTGSFYTPREIVNYMVDESLIAYLQNYLPVTQASSLSEKNTQDGCVTMSRRFLPHWQQNGATYFVTFRLADSLPQTKLQLLQQEKEEWQKQHPEPLSEAEKAEYYRLFSQRIDQWLDAGIGECYLKNPQLANIVADALRYFDGDRYHLGEWVVMPNHVHVIVTPIGNHKLSEITHSWKSFTANKINKILQRGGQLWQKESYDQIVRSPQHLERVQKYIANHPPNVAQASSMLNNQDDCATVTQASSLSQSNNQNDCATVTQASSLSQSNNQDDCATVTQASSLSQSNNQDDCATVTQASSLSQSNNQDDCATVTQASSLSQSNNQDDCATVTQASSLSQSNNQDDCATVTQASSLSQSNNQDDCATVTQASSLSQSNNQDDCATVTQASSLSQSNNQDDCVTRLRNLLSYSDESHQFNDDECDCLINAIDNLKIIDIACGSGAFPMGILQKLVFILGKIDPNNSKWKQQQKEKAIQPVLKDIQVAKQISYEEAREEAIHKLQARLAEIEDEFENNEMDYPRKLFLIENCIFGVDIQPIAVQISKLRFFISLIVDQKVNNNQPNRGILPLPNLETKFVAANSLIGLETQLSLRSPEVIKKEEELKQVRQQHFKARTPKTKRNCREKDKALRQEISQLLKSTGLETATADTLARWNPYDLNASSDFFDPNWMFGVDSFDICIGNPPYVRQEKIKELKATLKQQYNCYTGVADLYVYFFEQGIQLLKEKGILCYITSNKYFRSGYGQKLRDFLTKQTQLKQLIDFGDAPVFTAIAYPSIIITVTHASSVLNKSDKQDTGATIKTLNWEMGKPIDDFITIFNQESFEIEQKALKSEGWQLENNTVLRLLEKLRKAGTPLGEYVNGRFYFGIKTGFNEAFIVDRETRDRLIVEHPSSEEVLKPLVRGKDVKKWVVNNPDLWLIFTRRGIDINQYPAILNHLSQYRNRLTPGIQGGRKAGSYKWYEIQDNIAYYKELDLPKIIYPDIAPSAYFAYDTNKIYTEATLFFIPDATLYLLAILNSRSFNYFFEQVSPKIRGDFLRYKKIYLSQITIPKATDTQDACVTEIVNKVLEIKRQNPKADTTELEREIDKIVYELYGLSEEEIRIIEESVKR